MPRSVLEQRKITDTNHKKLADGSCRHIRDDQTENPKLSEEQNPYGAYVRPLGVNNNDEIIENFSKSEITRWSPWTSS